MEQMPMTPGDYLEIVKRRKWSLVLPAVTIFMAAGIVALFLPSIYQSQSTILIEEQEIPSDFVMTTVTGFAEQRIQQINQRIMSYSRLVEIIQRFELYPELKDKWTTEEIVEKMKDDTSLEPVSAKIVDKSTGRPSTATIAFTLAYEGKNPRKVQQVTNTLTSLFLEENLQVRERQAQDTSAFLESEMERVKTELAQIDSRIAIFKEAHMSELPEMLQLNMQTLNNIERNIELYAQQLRTLKEKEEYFQTQLASVAPFEEDQASRQRLEALKVELVHLTKRFSEEYPDVVKTRAEIAELETKLIESKKNLGKSKSRPDNPAYISLSAQLASTRSEIGSVNGQLAELNSDAAEYRNRIAATPKVEEAYNVLLNARNNTQAKYDDLMRKHMEARVAQGLEKEQKGERFTLIDPARFPEKPFKPNRSIYMVGGRVKACAQKESLSSQFPEVGLLHLLGGGGIEDVKHVYDYSTDVSFRRYCTLAFCLNDVRIAPEQSPGLPYVSSEISAQLDVMEDGDSISLVLTLINNSKSEKGWIYSSKSLSSNIEICREDGVPVYYPRQMLFILPEQKSIPSLERSTYEAFDVTVLQPNSVITRSEVLKLNKKSVSKIWSIREAYLHDRGPYYTLFDNIISRHIKHPLKLRIRYVYDSSLLDSFLLENGHINYPPDTALPHFRIESNPVELLINENGKLVSRIGVTLK